MKTEQWIMWWRIGITSLIITSIMILTPDITGGHEFEFGEHYFDLSGFASVGSAVRVADAEDLMIGFNRYERPSLTAQLNKVRFSLYGSHPMDVTSQFTLDLLYTSQPGRPFTNRGEVLLDEAYIDFVFKDADWRVGLQKVIWGKSDLISPFDILTARDLMDPFVFPTLEDRIAQPGIRVNFARGDYTVEAVLFPIWIRSRVPQAETDQNGDTRVDEWFPPMAIYPAEGVFIDDPTVNLAWMIFLPTYNPMKKPKKNPSTATFGVKVNTLKGEYDLDFYLVTAMDPMPTAQVKTVFAVGTIPEAELYDQGLLISIEGNIEFRRVLAVGAAGARTVGPLALRSELAFVSGKQYFRLFNPEDAEAALIELDQVGFAEVRGEPTGHSEMTWITGLDYEIPGLFILTSTQLALTKRFSHEDFYTQPGKDVDLTFLIRKGFQDDHLITSLAGMAGFVSNAVWISPALSYTLPTYEDLELGARFNVFAGEDFSKIGMYGNQSSLIFSSRWWF